jgi:DNA-binding PadR family transcriptional regulator
MPRDPQSLLPLRPVDTLILTTVAEGELHGYAIRQEILDHTGGRVELEAGNLYRYVRRLEEDGLVEPSSRRHAADDDPRRVYYRITPFGRRVLTAELVRMRELVELAVAKRIIGPRTA